MNTRYQVKGPIAEGGSGEVLLGWDAQLGREVAIKRVRKAAGGGEAEGSIDDLVKEARILSTLQHPNVVTVFDVGTDEDGAFIVMELVKGETLEETVARGALTEGDFETLVGQTLEGMIAAHAAGLIHLDLKPQNLMITWLPSGSFQVKILDFGLAMAASQPVEQVMDEDGGIMGSIFFMAPEQFERSPVDARTDLYALGCIFYYALTKQYPFRGETGPQVMTAHLYHKLRPLAKLRPDLPAFIPQWVDWLMSRLPSERPARTSVALKAYKERQLPPKPVAVVAAPAEVVEPTAVVAESAQGVVLDDARKVKRDLQPKGLLGEGTNLMTRQGSGTGKGIPRPKPAASRPPLLGKWSRFTIPTLAGLVILASIWFWIQKRALANRMARFAELVNEDVPKGTEQDVRLLLSFTGDANYSPPAAMALSKLRAGAATDGLILEAAKKANGRMEKVNLLNVVGLRGMKEGEAVALQRLKDSDVEVQKAAWNTLGTLAGPSSLPKLMEQAELLTEPIERFVEQALVAVVKNAEDGEAAVAPVINAYRSGLGPEPYRAVLVRVLGQVGGKEALVQLTKAIQGGALAVRKAAISAIGFWPTHEPLTLLSERAEAEDDAAARLMIFIAAGQLMAQTGPKSQEQLFGIGEKLYQAAKDRREKDQVLAAMGRVEVAETVAFFEKIATEEEPRQRQAQTVIERVREKLEKRVVMAGGEVKLTADKADFDRSAPLLLSDEALSGWENAGIWVSWLVEVPESGRFKVEVEQANEAEETGSYEVLVAGQKLLARSTKTKGAKDFQKFDVGQVEITSAGTYRLVLRAKQVPNGESLFRLRQVSLRRQ
jgi:HEAT repeat protein